MKTPNLKKKTIWAASMGMDAKTVETAPDKTEPPVWMRASVTQPSRDVAWDCM